VRAAARWSQRLKSVGFRLWVAWSALAALALAQRLVKKALFRESLCLSFRWQSLSASAPCWDLPWAILSCVEHPKAALGDLAAHCVWARTAALA
jgi:hypothetical protein